MSGVDAVFFDRVHETDFFCYRYPRLRQAGIGAGVGAGAGAQAGARAGASDVTLRAVTSAGRKEGKCSWVFVT